MSKQNEAPARLFVQMTRVQGPVFTATAWDTDPREVHDNGRPVHIYARVDPPVAPEEGVAIVDRWRQANDWPGLTWPDGPRPDQWPLAYEDLARRVDAALATRERETWEKAIEIAKGNLQHGGECHDDEREDLPCRFDLAVESIVEDLQSAAKQER